MEIYHKELYVIITAMAPYAELRLAIPLAWKFGLMAFEAYVLAVIGNMIPVVPIMLLIKPLSRGLDHIPVCRRFFNYILSRCRRHQSGIQKYGYWGLTLFVAVPLPMTGAWTGAALAILMGLRKRIALLAILLGVMIAGLIVTIATYGLAHLFGNSVN